MFLLTCTPALSSFPVPTKLRSKKEKRPNKPPAVLYPKSKPIEEVDFSSTSTLTSYLSLALVGAKLIATFSK